MSRLEILSLGAGVQSSTMALMAARGEFETVPDCAIFADTQAEPEGVYRWLDWLEPLLPFPVYRVTAGNLERALTVGNGGARVASVPVYTEGDAGREGVLRRQCTREYKVEPINRKIRELAGLKKGQRAPRGAVLARVWVGISLDEAVRMKPHRETWAENCWPLIDKRMTRHDCLQWMERNGFPSPAKSACVFCPYHDDALWRDMQKNDPGSFARAVAVDRAIRDGESMKTRQRLFLHRSLQPLESVDFSNAEDRGQFVLFGDECEGMCGV